MTAEPLKFDTLEKIVAQASFRRLKLQLENRTIIPFIGAGLSIPFGFPGWSNFILDRSTQESKFEVQTLLDRGHFEKAASRLEKYDPLLREDIKSIFGKDPKIPDCDFAARYLTKIFQKTPIFTTNYDRVLETLYQSEQIDLTAGSRNSDIDTILETKIPILIKIHGDALNDKDRILTENEYNENYGKLHFFVKNYKSRMKALVRLFTTESVLFIGCGLRNDRYMQVLAHLSPLPTNYAILPYDDSIARRALLRRCNIQPIWYDVPTAGDHGLLTHILRLLAGQGPELTSPREFILDVHAGENILKAISERLQGNSLFPDYENSAFSWILRYRARGIQPSIAIISHGEQLVVESSPALEIPGSLRKEATINVAYPPDGIRSYVLLSTSKYPISITLPKSKSDHMAMYDKSTEVTIKLKSI